MKTTGQVADLLAEIGLLRAQRDALQARRDDCAALLAEKQAEVENWRKICEAVYQAGQNSPDMEVSLEFAEAILALRAALEEGE